MRNIHLKIHIMLILMVSQGMASEIVKTYELCNRTIAVFDLVNAVLDIKEIDGTIIQSKLLTYQDYQSLKTNWPDSLWNMGMDKIPVCKRNSNEFILDSVPETGGHFSQDKTIKLNTGSGLFYRGNRPAYLIIDNQKIIGSVHYSSSDSMDIKKVKIEPNAHVMLHTGKTIVLKDGFHAKQGCSLRIFVSGN